VASSKKLPLWLRWWGLLAGTISLFWFPVEDVTLNFLILVSASWGIWLAGWMYDRGFLKLKSASTLWGMVLAGGLAGLMLPVAALVLVLIKAGLHGHGFLDFSFYQLGQILTRTPLWAGLGCLGGGLMSVIHRQ
jgi:hypothetical protein